MQHPDEGTIHSWLDGALTPDEARSIDEHVAACAQCAAAVADARGVLAAASRILSALDDVPGGVVPAPMDGGVERTSRKWGEAPVRGRFSATRWRAAAAVVIVAGGSWLVMQSRTPGTADRPEPKETQMSVASDLVAAPTLDTSVNTTQSPAPTTPSPSRVAVAVPQSSPAAGKAGTGTAGTAANTDALIGSAGAMTASRSEKRAENSVLQVTPSSSADRSDEGAKAVQLERDQRTSREILAESPPAMARPNASTNRALADSAALARASGFAKVGGAVAQGAVQDASTRRRETLIVIDHAYVDSVLAADSAQGAPGEILVQGADGGRASKMRSAAPAAVASPLERARSAGDFTERAVGCYTADTTAWLPRARGETQALGLVPARIELRRERGLSGDEWGNRLARPAPGEPALPPGAVGFWKPLGNEKVRVMFADDTSWTSLTLAIGPDSIRGPARAYSPSPSSSPGRLRSAQVSGRRVLCRTEP